MDPHPEEDLLIAYCHRRTSGDEESRIDEHLRHCSVCTGRTVDIVRADLVRVQRRLDDEVASELARAAKSRG